MITKFSSLPDPAALKRSFDAFAQATDKIAREREQMNFGGRIARAVKRKLASAQSRTAVSAEGGSFGEQDKKAVEKKSGKKQHDDRVERERDRYRPTEQRPHTKSD